MTCKNDLTALLPFPLSCSETPSFETPSSETPSSETPSTCTAVARRRTPSHTAARRDLIRLDRLDLAELVRSRRDPSRPGASTRRPARTRGARDSQERVHPSRETRRVGPVRSTPVGARTTAAHTAAVADPDPTTARAVPSGNAGFYLDLLGAVAVMALVLLATILV